MTIDLLEREGAGHDFAVDGAQGGVGNGAGVVFADALEDGEFAVGRVDFFAGLELDVADLEDVLGAFVQQANDLFVELIDSFAVFGEAH